MINRIRAARAAAGDEGFTLIEMLIVVVVLGILAGITVFGVAKFRQDAQATACDADVKIVQTASDAYAAQHKGSVAADMDALKTGGYLKSVPTDVSYAAGTASPVAANCT
jgi:general secretion pathway protein G